MDVQPVLVGREPERQALRAVVEPRRVRRTRHAPPARRGRYRQDGLGAGGCPGGRRRGLPRLVRSVPPVRANVTSYVPFTHALTHWLRTTTSDSRDRLAPHGSLDELVPALNDPSGGLALLQIGTAVDALQADGPTVLVVDDLPVVRSARWMSCRTWSRGSSVASGWPSFPRIATPTWMRATACTAGWPMRCACPRCPGSRWADGRVDGGGDGPGSRRSLDRSRLGWRRSAPLGREPLSRRPSHRRGPVRGRRRAAAGRTTGRRPRRRGTVCQRMVVG